MRAIAVEMKDLNLPTDVADAEPTFEERDMNGPKTAGAPDPTSYSFEELEKVLHFNPDLPEEQKQQLLKLAQECQGAFSLDGRQGKVKGSNFQILLKEGARPVAVAPYSAAPKKREVIDKQHQKWLVEDIIEPSNSPWSASVVVVYRNDKPRVCVDYRRINAMTIPDNFLLAKRDDIFQALAGKQWFSTLDCLAGFQQIVVDEASRPLTAFQSHRGRFQFKRLPFGLMNGPAEFQQVMQEVLAELLWFCTLVYIDDVVVYSMTFEDHLSHLRRTLQAVERWGLVLSPQKCFLGYRSLHLLGQNVSRLGVSTIEQKVEAVLKTPRPTDVPSLRSFLGMMNFYSGFVPMYAWIVESLFQLLRKDAPWVWGEKEDKAWLAARAALTEAPVLAHPQEGKPYRLYTDASKVGGSAILQQIQGIRVGDLKGTKVYDQLKKCFEKGQTPKPLFLRLLPDEKLPEPTKLTAPFDENVVYAERVIAIYARTWNKHERNLATTEQEALALKDGCIKFHGLIEGEEILAITDHEALKWAVNNFDTRNRKLQSWNTIFSAFKLKIVHRCGDVSRHGLVTRSRASTSARLSLADPLRTLAIFDTLTDGQHSRFKTSPRLRLGRQMYKIVPPPSPPSRPPPSHRQPALTSRSLSDRLLLVAPGSDLSLLRFFRRKDSGFFLS